MTSLSYWDEVSLVSILVYTITYQIGPMVTNDVRLLGSYYTILSLNPWENIEFIPKFVVTLTFKWDPRVNIFFMNWIIVDGSQQ